MRIVVGYVNSPEGEAAFERAIQETRLRDGTLCVVHSMRGDSRQGSEEMLQHRAELEAIEDRLEEAGVQSTVRDLVRGRSPAEDLVDVAKQEQANLLVVGLRRRSAVGKLVLGSNAQDILLHAPCPVLAVHADDDFA